MTLLRQGETERKSEEGSASILAVGIMAVSLLLCVVLIGVSQVHAGVLRAQTSADLAALAGADIAAVALWEEVAERACQRARDVADANGASVMSCRLDGQDLRVEVTMTVGVLGVAYEAQARARAGPAQTP